MKIVITDGYELNPGDLTWTAIRTLGEVAYYDKTSPDEVPERCSAANVIIVNKTRIDATAIEACENLRLIAVTATGYNNIDVNAAKKANVSVCNVPEYGTFSVAQHTFALLLELVNHVALHAESVRRKEWENSDRWSYSIKPLMELKDKTLGVIGFGRIGQRVAEMGKAFGMKIIFHNRSEKQSNLGTAAPLDQLFRESDVVTLHCPLTADNTGMVNAVSLASMKRSAFLINTSRGSLVNEADLAEALRNNVIAGAALDVLSVEPPRPGHPLIGLKNCIVTPHNAWLSFEARSRVMHVTFENIRRYMDGSPQNEV